MSMIYFRFVLLLSLAILISTSQPYKKITHNTDSKARCLDGSSPSLYFHQGSEKAKFLIYFQGGGYCQGTSLSEVLESCYARSKTNLGSSKDLPNEVDVEGFLSTDSSISKFANWTKILIAYCDGSLHQGSTDSSYRYKDVQLFFRGADNVRSHFKWLLNNYNFTNAEQVILTGTSAGGTASFLWSNYVRSLLANPRALFTVIDSGVFMNVASPETGQFKLLAHFQNLFKIANVNEKTPITYCNRFLAGEEYKCFFFERAFTSIQGSTLLIQSQYDSWAIENVIDVKCLKNGLSGKTLSACNPSELANIEIYRKAYLNFLNNYAQLSKSSVWTISCSNHDYSPLNNFYNVEQQKVPESTGLTVKAAIEKYALENQRISSIDQVAWPGNTACAN